MTSLKAFRAVVRKCTVSCPSAHVRDCRRRQTCNTGDIPGSGPGGFTALIEPLSNPDDPDPFDAVPDAAAARIEWRARFTDRQHARPPLLQPVDRVLGELQGHLPGGGYVDGAQPDRAGEERDLALGHSDALRRDGEGFGEVEVIFRHCW